MPGEACVAYAGTAAVSSRPQLATGVLGAGRCNAPRWNAFAFGHPSPDRKVVLGQLSYLLAAALGELHRSPDVLIRSARVNIEHHGHLDGLVELGPRAVLDELESRADPQA